MTIEIVDFPINSMMDLSIVFCMFTRPGRHDFPGFFHELGDSPASHDAATLTESTLCAPSLRSSERVPCQRNENEGCGSIFL